MKYPIGIQSFEDIRNKGYAYVDKTHHIYNLADTGKCYFLSRPRRFGKSLLISTMEAYFSGKKELFQGLILEKLETKWVQYPILHLDLNSRNYISESSLIAELNSHLERWETLYGDKKKDRDVEERFEYVISKAYEKTGKQVVILIDEYDKPLLQTIGNKELQDKYRGTLKAFYSVMKTQDKYIRFAFLTGVTKFGKVSIFSDLNNLNDISMDEDYFDICGISEKEIHIYFENSIHELAEKNKLTYKQTCDKLREQYDGYHFEYDTNGIYNPFSLLNTFAKRKFGDYWFETGTPSFLVELLKATNYNLNNLQKEKVAADILNSIESMFQNPIPVIYQSGYLTIKDYDARYEKYILGFPNMEVEKGFVRYLLPFYTPRPKSSLGFVVEDFIADAEEGRPEEFMQRMQAFFADGDYQVAGDMENYFQNCMWIIFKMMGFYTQIERHTSNGRVDIVLETNDYIYIIELKLDGSAEEALQQIEDKGYAKPFAMDSRKLFKIGVNFSSATRGIEEYLIR